jgi:alcohol dehydrogenase (cytochrome c)
MRSKRLAIFLVLAAGGVLVGLLSTGVLSRTVGGKTDIGTTRDVATTTLPNGTTTPQSETANNPFGPNDWGAYGGSFDQNRHSQLTEITKQNISDLGRVADIDFRRIDARIPRGQQSFPIVVNGILYVTTANAWVFAFDGGSGKELWRWKPENTGVFANYGVNANRGVAYCDGKVFVLTLDMKVVSLDAASGKLVKQVAISDSVPGASTQYSYSETQAPICFDNILVFGASGSDYGVRGFTMALKSDLTAAWSSPYWIIPPDGEDWRRFGVYTGGGTNWNPGTIDAETGTLYITTSNPSPIFNALVRPGPNPRTDSVVALDLYTGEQKWWQQQIPGDQWGYSTVQPVLLYNVKIGGKTRRVVSVATKEGTWFMYDAKTGAPIHTRVKLINQLEHPKLRPGQAVTVYPSSLGGLNYSPSSYDPTTGYVINNQSETAAVLTLSKAAADVDKNKTKGDVFTGLEFSSFGIQPDGWHDYGSITAIDAAQGKIAWKRQVAEPGRGGITTTASGLAFAGGGDGQLVAFDTYTGNQLWAFQTGYQIAAGPTIYQVDGKQYIAITVGGTPTSSYGGTASRLQIFALGGNKTQSRAPQIAANPDQVGVLRAPPKILAPGAKPHTLTLQLVSSQNDDSCKPTLNGYSKGKMKVRAPKGWKIYVTFVNHGVNCADGVAVVNAPGETTPVFKDGSSDAASESAAGVRYFQFTASKEGKYAIASTKRDRALAGEWLEFTVSESDKPPLLTIQTFGIDQTFEIVARERGLGG